MQSRKTKGITYLHLREPANMKQTTTEFFYKYSDVLHNKYISQIKKETDGNLSCT